MLAEGEGKTEVEAGGGFGQEQGGAFHRRPQDPDTGKGSLLPLNTEDQSVRWRGSSNENKGES